MRRRAFLRMAAAAAVEPVRGLAQRRDATDAVTLDAAARAYRVQPGGSIQAALEAAAKDPANKIVYVHAGTYRPAAHGQALIWFNERHDGITLEAVGEVVQGMQVLVFETKEGKPLWKKDFKPVNNEGARLLC